MVVYETKLKVFLYGELGTNIVEVVVGEVQHVCDASGASFPGGDKQDAVREDPRFGVVGFGEVHPGHDEDGQH